MSLDRLHHLIPTPTGDANEDIKRLTTALHDILRASVRQKALVTTIDLQGGQIRFPATQNASTNANTLDDYEEGTWTPSDSSGAGLTFTGASGYYVKIGGWVYVTATATYPVTASGAGSKIGGLPFTVKNNGGARNGDLCWHDGATATKFLIDQNATTGIFFTNAGVQVTNAQMSTFTFFVSALYPV